MRRGGSVPICVNEQVNAKALYAVSNSPHLTAKVVEPVISQADAAVVEVTAKAPAQPGVYRWNLSVSTSSQKWPTVHLPVVVSVSEEASVSPPEVDFGRFVRGHETAKTMELSLANGTKLKTVTARPPVLDVNAPVHAANATGTVELRPRKEIPFGPIQGELHLTLEGGEKTELVVPFHGYACEDQSR